MPRLQFDIDCDNFDFFFSKSIENIGELEKSDLPKEIHYKLFKRGGELDYNGPAKLSFLAKLFVLFKTMKKRWWLIVEGEGGVTEEQFFQLKARLNKRDYSTDTSESLISSGFFVLGSRELTETFSRLNYLSVSPAYNFLVKSKNTELSKTTEYKQQMNYLFKMLCFYESQKKKMVMDTGVSIPEYLVLIFCYNKGEVVSSQIHKEVYKYAYNSSSTQIKLAFGTLQRKGYIEKYGHKKGVSIKITALGIERLNYIAHKYIINF